ncbi:MAG: FxLYD domain-containing protein [Bacillota bacterium]|nr:FxLYD domain-containing protein [Bacillota bacterium]
MALIKCTECGKEFSDKADACPNCGCPKDDILKELKQNEIQNEVEKQVEPAKEEVSEKKPTKLKFALIAVVIVVVFGIGYYAATGNSRNYAKAQELIQAEDFSGAKTILEELGDYEDSKELLKNVNYQLSTDGTFIREMSKGLMERWDKNEEYKGKEESSVLLEEYCQVELDRVEKYYDKKFDDEKLGILAQAYIDSLKDAKEAAKQYAVNYVAYSENWLKAYGDRTMAIVQIVEDYGLTVDEAYEKTLQELVTSGKSEDKNRRFKKTVLEMCEGFTVKSSTDEWGYSTYKVEMKNTTDVTFEYFYIDVNYLDKDGNIKTTGSSSQVQNWKPGQTATMDYWIVDDKVNVSALKMEYNPHYSTGDLYE